MDEKKLLRMLDRQPNEALALILREYGGLLNGVAMSILRDPQDAEECVADGLVKLWSTRDRIQKPENLKSYLCAIVRNGALDRRRKKAPVQELSLRQELLEDYALSRQLDGILLTDLVTRSIRSLGEPASTIFLQRYYQELTIEEIAAAHGLTARAVESHLYRGRKKLKERFVEGGRLDEAE